MLLLLQCLTWSVCLDWFPARCQSVCCRLLSGVWVVELQLKPISERKCFGLGRGKTEEQQFWLAEVEHLNPIHVRWVVRNTLHERNDEVAPCPRLDYLSQLWFWGQTRSALIYANPDSDSLHAIPFFTTVRISFFILYSFFWMSMSNRQTRAEMHNQRDSAQLRHV